MVEAGRGRLDARKIAVILEGRDRHAAPANAPPGGLYLLEVRY
jgi:tRNA U38,U39,U40 pseudouridine synthase TruA